ncbi:MAG TPA: stage III sporulation protein AB [Syntrophomonadaceae bacterium]|nr:stage III sporulation protein AB [Syntrophomonadaceae bacterium]
MSFKLIGIALVIGGFGLWGLLGAKRIEKRVKQLKNLRLAIGFLEKEITYNYTPLTHAMERTYNFSPKPINIIFNECASLLRDKDGITGDEAWSKAIRKSAHHLDLKPEDLDLILTASNQLGMSDVNEQRKFFVFIQQELKIQEDKAVEDVTSNQKLWSYGGFILGLIVVILII